MDTVSKIYTGILLRRLENWVESFQILNECQAGFRKGYSTVDSIYTLTGIIKLHCKMPKKKVYACFVDFKAAFDTVDRNALFYKLFNCGLSRKFIKNLQSLYKDTKACIWNGEQQSQMFETTMGVKQGCLLSPILFSLYLNDLNEELSGGISISNFRVKLLMYADDIVMIAEDPKSLQTMILQLSSYCQKWNLTVNTEKTKVMIFGQGGRRSKDEKWEYGGEQLEIVNTYTYLGMNLTPKLSFQPHLKTKLSSGKANINAVWANIIRTKSASMSSMYNVFKSVNRSFLCYGAQVWGYEEYEEVEKFQRFFIKKVLCLPSNTPNYMINLECNLQNVFTYTLKLHFGYIIKTMGMEAHRFPRIVTELCILKNVFWINAWLSLGNKCGYTWNFADVEAVKQTTKNILTELPKLSRISWEDLAKISMLHDEYKNLDFTAGSKYINDNTSVHQMMTIFKARGGLLNINSRSFQRNTSGFCSLCNRNEEETTYHFIAICPVLREFRIQYFNARELSKEELIEQLNGKDYPTLYNYIKTASKYRSYLVNEFNI